MKSVEAFLNTYRQDAASIDADRLLAIILSDMEAGLGIRSAHMEMNPSYLSPDIKVLPNRKAIVIDAGGTRFRNGLASTDGNGKVTLAEIRSMPMPGSGHMLTKTAFYDAVASGIADLADAAEAIGFCFSYSVAMTPDGDGILTDWAKEIDAPEVIGSRVGACTSDALKKFGGKAHHIALLNDTVATLLGGINSVAAGRYAGGVGFVCGTGINACYAEACENIGKLTVPATGDRMIINTECGNYDRLPQGRFDRLVDLASQSPGKAKAEKMVSGKYLADVIALALRQSINDGLFVGNTDPFDEHDVTLPVISAFVANPYQNDDPLQKAFSAAADRETVASIAKALIDRAAKIGALMTAAAVLKTTEKRHDPRPVAIYAEGTTFQKLTGYQEAYAGHLRTMLRRYGITFEIVTGSDWNLLGAAVAAMSIKKA